MLPFGVAKTKYVGNYRGVVLDNLDPLQLGRIKVEVLPMFRGIAADILPWTIPAFGLFGGAGDDYGSFTVPPIGSKVWCFFESGDIYQPVYFASAQDGVTGLPTELTPDYPTTQVWKTSGGWLKTLNDTLGDVYTSIVRDLAEVIGRTKELTIGYDYIVTIVRDYLVNVGRNFTVAVTNMASIIDLTGQRLSQTGDIKPSFAVSLSGWLLLVPNTVGNTGSGATYVGEAYRALFNILKTASPNVGSEDFDTGDTVILPDFRGRSPLGMDNMGGEQANVLTAGNTPNRNVLGGTAGEETHTLIIAEMPKHNHSTWYAHNGGSGSESPDGGSTCNRLDATTGLTGGDGPHNNIGPKIMTNWFVKI